MYDRQELTIEEIHQGTLEIMKQIISICDEININYYLMFGSLLGAVRHKGFIPWDDDFDICMLRKDYDKFVTYCEENQKNLFPYRLMNRRNTKNYPFNISRFCDLSYEMESDNMPTAGMGMFIDVYPMEGDGNKEKISKREEIIKKIYMNAIFSCYQKEFISSNKKKSHDIILYVFYKIAKLFNAEFWLDCLENRRKKFKYEESDFVSCVVWDDLVKYNKSHFEGYELLPFENLMVKVPKDYEIMLKKCYGDYLKLPPLEERGPSHNYKLYKKKI